MPNDEKIEKIESVTDRIESAEDIGKDKISSTDVAPNKDYFEALMMQERKKAPAEAPVLEVEKKASIMDEVRNLNYKVDHISRAGPTEIAHQAEKLIAQIDEVKSKLSTSNLEIKDSVQTLLRSKLSHIDESLKVALSKAGVEYTPPEKQTGLATPIERFLGFLTHAQSQLENLGDGVQSLTAMKGQLSPATMLAIQVKVGYVQQEIELFTSLLNKLLESTKTVMNVQV